MKMQLRLNLNFAYMTNIDYRIKVLKGDTIYWTWACENLEIGTWKMLIGFLGESATYSFCNEEDLTAFKLRFGL
jgi:hypothetical protein